MQEVFSKIIEELEIERTTANNTFVKYEMNVDLGRVFGLEKAIEIVKQVAAEYNNGWIPCEVSMPKERDSIFKKYKGTEKWNDCMFEKTSDEVNVTVADEKGDSTTIHAYTIDGKWSCDFLRVNKKYRVIAWQPLPDSYHPKGEYHERKTTNADQIRSMSDEELAEFLERFGSFNHPCNINKGEPLKWLQSEVEE